MDLASIGGNELALPSPVSSDPRLRSSPPSMRLAPESWRTTEPAYSDCVRQAALEQHARQLETDGAQAIAVDQLVRFGQVDEAERAGANREGGAIAMRQREFALRRHQHLERRARAARGAAGLVADAHASTAHLEHRHGAQSLPEQRTVEIQGIARLHMHRVGQSAEKGIPHLDLARARDTLRREHLYCLHTHPFGQAFYAPAPNRLPPACKSATATVETLSRTVNTLALYLGGSS